MYKLRQKELEAKRGKNKTACNYVNESKKNNRYKRQTPIKSYSLILCLPALVVQREKW